MHPKRLALLAVLLCAAPAARLAASDSSVTGVPGIAPGPDVEPGTPFKLVFTYPCTFAYENGKPYENRVMDYECDYMHASIADAAATFNNYPTLTMQKAFLMDVIPKADRAHNEYVRETGAAIAATDPARLPKNLSQTERLKRIAALNVALSTTVFLAAKPFLWPPREEESYVQKTAGSWPPSWTPYIQPIYDRSSELQGMVQESEMKLIDQASAELDKKLKAASLQLKKSAAGAPAGISADGLARLFDGGAALAATAPLAGGPGRKKTSGADVVNAVPIAMTDLRSQPPPIPTDEDARRARNYFARGTAAGLARLKDDQIIGAWHAFGLTTTIGDPNGKAALIFHQKGPTCALSSEDEALNARGDYIPAAELVKEGYRKGYYVEYAKADGSRDGGPVSWNSVDFLLKDHGVKSTFVPSNATPEALDRAIRSSPQHDAIVYIDAKPFWNDPNLRGVSPHAIYVTGEEVDKSGTVRGIYINDTGQGEAARFVPIDEFKKVWLKSMVTFQP